MRFIISKRGVCDKKEHQTFFRRGGEGGWGMWGGGRAGREIRETYGTVIGSYREGVGGEGETSWRGLGNKINQLKLMAQ